MSEISERLLRLSPEKRDILLQRINKQTRQAMGQDFQPRAAETRPFGPGDENFKLRIRDIGDLDSLIFEACPRLNPKPRQVVIQVYGASLNFRDVMTAFDMYPQSSSRDPLLGDCAGKIVAVGEGVHDLQVGDEVLGLAADPYSAFVTTWSFNVVRKPASMTFEEASTIPTVYATVYYSLHHLARLSRGEKVLIHSAAGGIGLAAVQVARWLGAEIVATVGNSEKREYLRSIGIERIANSRNPNFDEEVRDLTNGEGVDVVLNSLAGEAIAKGLSLLRPLGRFIELGKRDVFGDGKLDLALFRKFLSFSTVDLGTISLRPFFFPMLTEIMDHFAKGTFSIVPTRVFPIGEISEAFKYMSRSQHIGKIAVRIKDEEVLLTSR